jgi:sugar O-acyltransferase (sialic acid O-acetyltransferase NeuD family)
MSRKQVSAPRQSAQKIVILGIGGNCIDILDTLNDINVASARLRFQCMGFLDDDPAVHGRRISGIPVIGGLKRARSISDVLFVNGIGSPATFRHKPEIIASTGLSEARFISIVHPTAVVSSMATVGVGTVILQNSVIASNAKIGGHVMILPLTVVSHHSVVGDYSTIAGGVSISGYVRIGRACYIGSHCAIREHVSIGDRALCGIGSVVLKDVPARAVVAGNPARHLRGAKKSSR